jgi:hypothetical protein
VREELSDAFSVITLGNLQAFHRLPELKDVVVIVDGKFPSNDLIAHVVVKNSTTISSCHSERREESLIICVPIVHGNKPEMFRFAQHDRWALAMLIATAFT